MDEEEVSKVEIPEQKDGSQLDPTTQRSDDPVSKSIANVCAGVPIFTSAT